MKYIEEDLLAANLGPLVYQAFHIERALYQTFPLLDPHYFPIHHLLCILAKLLDQMMHGPIVEQEVRVFAW